MAPFPFSHARFPLLLAAAALALGGCDRRPDDTAVAVSVVGGTARVADPSRTELSPAERVLMGATAQGLVRFDAAGQVEPALAERWIVIDEGQSYIFRLGDARWPDGNRVTASEVVATLKRAVRPAHHKPLAGALRLVDEIVEMTPEVVEIRLRRPQPEFLKLLAQPELAIFQARGLRGTGPFELGQPARGAQQLRPIRGLDDEDADTPPSPAERIELRGDRAARAVLRFTRGDRDLVLGGGVDDWPLLAVADVARESIRVDPAVGLFGLAVARRQGFLAETANRAALAGAFDRSAIAAGVREEWTPATTLLPAQLDSAAAPAAFPWPATPTEDTIGQARARVAIWMADHPDMAPLRIALPQGPGGNLLWRGIARSLRAIGLPVERVAIDAPDADLRLVDKVAPLDSGRWYLDNACVACDPMIRSIIDSAADAPDAETRGRLLADGDAALAADASFVPIALPLRWSLVSPRLRAWAPNPRAWHPLNHLRGDPS
ncbi:ABC transporter substrate-binding protein [Sphingomonas sp. ACRSK]|uniref:ABC transporter substrate-binding protein n=1 Tax=Sphingomonas sp. ACRSK TaxID=2918213 RepID=UPI001EF4D629|nr:ABC transporter substrate-binding protein [Sphingomonas sp. ACRSK]MCG7347635.1 ABC transporter substrate-binding protein [Sphingomonas sp. ACRSK]